jgi:hypothetical protein
MEFFMKKVLATILAIIYLSTSMGATIHLHYCMDKLVAWGLLDHSGKDCSFCGMQKKQMAAGCTVVKKDCCRDEHRQIKNSQDQKMGQTSVESAGVTMTAADVPFGAWTDPFVASPVLTQPADNGPPEAGDVPVFLRNRNFRI